MHFRLFLSLLVCTSVAKQIRESTEEQLRDYSDSFLRQRELHPHKECKNNAGCYALRLTGDCCPTIEGVMLDCCSDENLDDGQGASCSANAGCAAYGLLGKCCPHTNNITLDCCSQVPDPTEPPHPCKGKLVCYVSTRPTDICCAVNETCTCFAS